MKPFNFKGELASSKSILNRALIAKSFSSDLEIIGDSICDDVVFMKNGLQSLINGAPVECGHAATVLRFLAVRASRIPGRHVLRGSERLFSRPQDELIPILGQLGVPATFGKNELVIQSSGWRLVVDGLQINAQRSSQFASAIVLNGWDLKLPLHFHIPRNMVSGGYFQMTVALVRALGMRIEENGSEFIIPGNQKVTALNYSAEIDLSSAFAVAAMALVAGEACIQKFPLKSIQPDAVFVQILQDMCANIKLQSNELWVRKTPNLQGTKTNLENSPDLFPILGVLCALAETPSEINGLGHLKFKESSRLEKTKELLEMMGAKVTASDSSVIIYPSKIKSEIQAPFVFNVDQDHRMAMAARVAQLAGYAIQFDDLNVVTKSFPEFLSLTGDLL